MDFQQLMKSNGELISLSKQDFVFRQGEMDGNLYFVKSGLLKAFYLSKEGKESIKSFLVPGDVIGSLTSAHNNQPCTFGLLCLQPTELVKMSLEIIRHSAEKSHELSLSVINVLIAFAMKKERREYELLCLSAEERYRLLLQSSIDIISLVTQNDLARYLGITPVALSRIKKRIR